MGTVSTNLLPTTPIVAPLQTMSKMILLLGLVLTQLSSSSSYTIRVAINVETGKQDSSAFSPKQNVLIDGLIPDQERSLKKLTSCGVPEILQCTGKIEEAAASCINHHNLPECIQELIGAESECNNCIKVICKALHIHSCM